MLFINLNPLFLALWSIIALQFIPFLLSIKLNDRHNLHFPVLISLFLPVLNFQLLIIVLSYLILNSRSDRRLFKSGTFIFIATLNPIINIYILMAIIFPQYLTIFFIFKLRVLQYNTLLKLVKLSIIALVNIKLIELTNFISILDSTFQ